MSRFMLMEPANQRFQELMGNGVRYHVPRFQRDYAWDQEQWEDLWADIEGLEDDPNHYMGYIVLQRKEQNQYAVIDGQQRMVTISLLILAAIKQIERLASDGINPNENQQRIDILTDRFIGSRNPISLQVDSKLSLNRNNRRDFKSICTKREVPNQRGITRTNRLLHRAFEFFASKPMGETGQEIAQFVDMVASGMVFTKIVVGDSLNAYKVFETLNARGVQLSTPDLVKNYIFSVVTRNGDVNDGQLDELDESWSGIIEQLGENNFTNFVRYHHNFQEKLVKKRALFSAIRNKYTQPKEAYAYLDHLTRFAPIYASLLNPEDEWWRRQDDGYRDVKLVLEGLNLFQVRQPFVILMIAFQEFTAVEFVRLTRYLYVLSIRYNVICHNSPQVQENDYNQIAMKIFQGEFTRASHVKNSEAFRRLYPDDQTFMNAAEFHKMPSRQSSKRIRFLLAAIENKLNPQETDYLSIQLEHICPYNPEQVWREEFGEGVNEVRDRLGNMVLLNDDRLKRAPFAEKKAAYLDSGYALAQKVAQYNTWNLRNLNHYQAWLAERAAETWRIDWS